MYQKFTVVVRLFILLTFVSIQATPSKACNAYFTHTYACAGDTIFFNAWDQAAVYTWDFGDSLSGGGNISHDTDAYHVFVNPGTYYVTLFVNIGAEWDYRTEIITIGTDCFNASFDWQCQGGNAMQFTNQSTGDNITSFWSFGDPASGSSDTTSLLNPYHTFLTTGSFTVTLITTDGTQSDTMTQVVDVDSVCLMATIYNNLGGDCVQNVTYMNTYYYSTPSSYLWDYGDPASGSANTSTDSSGMHQYSAPGVYLVTLIISDGVQTDTFYTVQNIIDCNVWPGNVNRDGEVNMEDLFALGIYYNDIGTTRLGASSNWTGQQSADWMSLGFNGIMYLQDIVDKKNADCNGDGVVNNSDITLIDQNYGNRLPNYRTNDQMIPVSVRSTDPVLQVMTNGANYTAGDTVHLSIDLSSSSMMSNVYGISAKLFYDPAFVVSGSLSITYAGSWMGSAGGDLLTLYKDFPANGYVDFGMVRTDKVPVIGSGQIAQLNFVLESNVSGPMSLAFDPAVKLISNGLWNNNQEIFYPVNVVSGSMLNVLAGIRDIKNQAFSVYPNPAGSQLSIQMKTSENLQSWAIVDALGKICSSGNVEMKVSSHTINTSALSEGVYSIRVVTDSGVYSQPVLIR